ncbi:MAG: hypothetical protein JRF27_03875 [Deltaproteobacteria bacterium]|nr:hypothetical protein [Deltaproteobacteria bacterium]
MSIRMLARELYQLLKKVEAIEKQILDAPVDQREALKDQLRKTKAEQCRMRKTLDGRKG